MSRVGTGVALAGVLLASCTLLAGCTSGGVPSSWLPGGAGGGDVYHVDAVFDDVLDLVPKAAVKVNDVGVGSVENIRLDSFKARVRLRVNRAVVLPADAVATLRQTSLLGEKFIELAPPPTGGSGRLVDGAVIPATRSSRNPEVEEVFSALSALLSGGGLTEIQTIAVELSRALGGREQQVRGALRRITELVGALDTRKTEIVRAIDALDRLTATFAGQRQTIAAALDEFTPALTVLADQRDELTKLLQKAAKLGEVGTRVIRASREDTLADLRLLAPILDEVVKVKGDLAATVDLLLPLTQLVQKAIPGDYLQLLVTIYLDQTTTPVPAAPGSASPSRRSGAGSAARPTNLTELLMGVVR